MKSIFTSYLFVLTVFCFSQELDLRILGSRSYSDGLENGRYGFGVDLTKETPLKSTFVSLGFYHHQLSYAKYLPETNYATGRSNEYSLGLGVYFTDYIYRLFYGGRWTNRLWGYFKISPTYLDYKFGDSQQGGMFAYPIAVGAQYKMFYNFCLSVEYKRTFTTKNLAMLGSDKGYNSFSLGLSYVLDFHNHTIRYARAPKSNFWNSGGSRKATYRYHARNPSNTWSHRSSGPSSYTSNSSIQLESTESYAHVKENEFYKVESDPMSTFSIDVDEASYTNIRRMINNDQVPVPDAVRVEEMINYFDYNYAQPTDTVPFSVMSEQVVCPWDTTHQLVRIGIQGKTIPKDKMPKSNVVFLIDVSGSMADDNKIEIIKTSLIKMVDSLSTFDKVSIVTYANKTKVVINGISGDNKDKLKNAIKSLSAQGYTDGGNGLKSAYKCATENFIPDGNNRIILCTDGDFNVGPSSDAEMLKLIEEHRKQKVYITVVGCGSGNLMDSKMEVIADNGNGNYFYVDSEKEGEEVFVNDLRSNFYTIAKDVKIQVEFNPKHVQAYRLIGYENRVMEDKDFNDDEKDAGEIGPGHNVTAVYEIIPRGEQDTLSSSTDELRYQKTSVKIIGKPKELMYVKLRYKKPDGDISMLTTHTVFNNKRMIPQATGEMGFIAGVIEFGMLLKDSKFKGTSSYENILTLSKSVKSDKEKEFVELVKKWQKLQENPSKKE